MKKYLALCQGRNVPSSRFRIKNILTKLISNEIHIDVRDACFSAYPPKGTVARVIWFFKELFSRIPDIIISYRYDAVIFQRELISTIPTLERFSKKPRILDVDDAIWLHRGGWAANNLAKRVDHIVCGNQYIATYFKRFGKPITIIPTGVDIERFIPRSSTATNKIIGWSGTSGGFKFLYGIEPSIAQVLSEYPDWKLRIVSDRPPVFKLIQDSQLEFICWTEECEVSTIQEMDIGLMPLDDTPWSQGKCSYKMLLYMACGLPVVVSDFGMNREVLGYDFVGYGVTSKGEWYSSIKQLIDNEENRLIAGANGRKVIIDYYSTEKVVQQWKTVLDTVEVNG